MDDKVEQPAGNFYDKYNTRNPIARALMDGFLGAFDGLVADLPAGEALEIGCGEAELSMRLARAGWQVSGCDIADEAVAEARQRVAQAGLDVEVERHDVAECAGRYSPRDLVVCCEVLEHLENPAAALETLAKLSRGHILVSVPREPIWRALNMLRGRYWSDVGNTPGHINHWSQRAFLTFLSQRLEIVAVRQPLPWTMVLCRAGNS